MPSLTDIVDEVVQADVLIAGSEGAGARAALISQSKRKEAQNFSRQIRYIELAGFPGFFYGNNNTSLI